MTADKITALEQNLREKLPGTTIQSGLDCPVVLVAEPSQLIQILTTLRDDAAFDFKLMVDITAVHYPERTLPFEMVYHLLSVYKNHRVRIKMPVDSATPVPTATPIWYCADWYERETYEMFGILFEGHPDLRRLLTEYDMEGHPLRKDFPVSGHFQVRYDESEGRVIREPVKLSRPNREYYGRSV
jgi:NADH-quinone oxidoreductase subunit C